MHPAESTYEPIACVPHSIMKKHKALPIIKVVGMSASGKSTLVKRLRALGYDARPVSQEHSNIPTLWQHFDQPAYDNPHWLIYLDARLACQRARRPDVSWTPKWHQTEQSRLGHARGRADFRVDTSDMTPAAVAEVVLIFLRRHQIEHADEALPPITPTGGGRR